MRCVLRLEDGETEGDGAAAGSPRVAVHATVAPLDGSAAVEEVQAASFHGQARSDTERPLPAAAVAPLNTRNTRAAAQAANARLV